MTEPRTITAIGEILVEFVSHSRDCALETITEYSGPYPSGAPAIFVDQAARLGAATNMIGGVGADGFGRIVRNRLTADGVGTDGITTHATRPTGTAFVSYYSSGARDFIFHLSGMASDDFDVPAGLFDPANCALHVSASSLGVPPLRTRIMDAVRSGGRGLDHLRPECPARTDARPGRAGCDAGNDGAELLPPAEHQ